MLTAKPIVSPCVKHEIEGLGLSEDSRDCRYCCALQTVPFTPPNAAITIAVNGLERCVEKKPLAKTLLILSANGERKVRRDLKVRVRGDGK